MMKYFSAIKSTFFKEYLKMWQVFRKVKKKLTKLHVQYVINPSFAQNQNKSLFIENETPRQ